MSTELYEDSESSGGKSRGTLDAIYWGVVLIWAGLVFIADSQGILPQIGVADLNEHIKFEVVYTPHDWQTQYNLAKGATHGLSHDLLQMGYLRPHNRHSRYRNLYFVGASTHPGTGLPVVLVSARLAAERILREAGAPRTHANHQSRAKSAFRPVHI